MDKKTKKQIAEEILTELFKLCVKDNLDYPTDFELILTSILFNQNNLKYVLQKEKVDRMVINTKVLNTSLPKFKEGLEHVLSDK